MNRFPLVSIITINYNKVDVTCEFLESTKSLTYPNYEIIVIDNASVEDPEVKLKKTLPSITYIKSSTNLGFAGGNNLGISKANGEYYFIVNNDTEVTENLLECLIEPFLSNPEIGMVCPKIRFFDHPDAIQYAGYSKINPMTGRNRTIGEMEPDKGQHDMEGFTNYAHGAAMMVSRQVVEEVGVFDTTYFMYYEELDWSARTTRGDFKIFYQPKGLIFHKESMTIGRDNPIKTYYLTRNRIFFMRKYSNAFEFTFFLIFLLLFTIPKNTIVFLLKRNFEHLKKFYSGIFWNFKH